MVTLFAGVLLGGDLTVKVTNDSGKPIMVALFDGSGKFPKEEFAIKKLKIEGTSHTFKDLKDGSYAISLYEDLDEDKEMDKLMGMIPTEPYGLSNNFKPTMGAPKFEECSFSLSGNKTIEIRLVR